MSLRTRLLSAVVLAALIALVIVDTATYTVVTRGQLDQVDQELERSHPPIERAATAAPTERETLIRAVAPASYVELRNPVGDTIDVISLRRPGQPELQPDPDVIPTPRADGSDDEAVYATVPAGGDAMRVRVSRQSDGDILVIGQSLETIEHTRHRLLAVLVGGTLGALLAVALVGAWLVRLGLAPLTAVERTAADITGSRLDHRVPGDDRPTEVGRLARAINTMLDRLHGAFEQRERDLEALRASEARMRRFVADASHELRTPLAATSAYAELFERGARDHPEDLERAMTGIRTETARMSELVEDLLLLAQLDEGRPLDIARVDLSEIAVAAVDAARAVDPDRTVALRIHDVVAVDGDQSRIRQVLDNLLGNVRVHTPAGTGCVVEVGVDGTEAVVSVTDQGPGLPDDQLSAVTDRFHRVETSRTRAAGGAGLGLSIVAAIVAAHRGTVELANSPGGGLRATVRLPLAGAPTQEEPTP